MGDVSHTRTGVLEARYANQFQVGHNEYEFVFDFGQFHAQELSEPGAESSPLRIVRIVMGPPFAKALLATLTRAMGEYERLHGAIAEG